MRIGNSILTLALAGMAVWCHASEKEEHRAFARTALDTVLERCQGSLHDSLKNLFLDNGVVSADAELWNGWSFADFSANFAGKDISRQRSHRRANSTMQQLAELSREEILQAWLDVGDTREIKPLENGGNVFANYLLHHLVALRFMERGASGEAGGEQDRTLAFIYEAIAQSYLADAFSSGHMLIRFQFLAGLQSCNYRKAHAFFSSHGVYVMNSRGDAWQAFGDKLMLWYEPTYRFTLDACVTSLQELLLVFYATIGDNEATIPDCLSSLMAQLPEDGPVSSWLEGHSGETYYATLKMPSLLALPMPVTACWSYKSDSVHEHGIHRRLHYPQLKEPGLHDPDLAGIETGFLYSRAVMPGWLIPPAMEGNSTAAEAVTAIRENPDVASVRYTQKRDFPAPYFGAILSAAAGGTFAKNVSELLTFGVGFGFLDSFVLLKNLSVDLQYTSVDGGERHFLTTTAGAGIDPNFTGALGLISAFRFDLGHAWRKGDGFDLFDYQIAAGIEFPVLPLGLTYAAITPRIMVQRIFTGSATHMVYFQVVFH